MTSRVHQHNHRDRLRSQCI